MFPEKEIVGLWLNSRGYLVVNDLNAGKTVIDALALKVEKGSLLEVVHVEVSVSVSGSPSISDVKQKFSDTQIHGKILGFLSQFGEKKEIKKLLVMSRPKKRVLEDVEVKPFEEVLAEVLANLDKQNYSNPTIRTLQLFKFLLLTNTKNLGGLLNVLENKGISRAGMEFLVGKMLETEAAKRVFKKKTSVVKDRVSKSSLINPDELAELAAGLSTRSFNVFLKKLFEQERAKSFTKKTSPKQRSLSVFIE